MFLLQDGAVLLQDGPTLLQGDPTGMSSWAGRLVVIAILLSVLVLAVRWFWNQRKR